MLFSWLQDDCLLTLQLGPESVTEMIMKFFSYGDCLYMYYQSENSQRN